MSVSAIHDDDYDPITASLPVDSCIAYRRVLETTQPPTNTVSTISSIEESSSSHRAPLHRPRLEPPKHYMLDLLDMHQQVENTVSRETLLFKQQCSFDFTEIDRLEKEKEEALERHIKEASSRDAWRVLGTIAQYLYAGTSLVVGLSVLEAAPWAGGLLLASGIAGLGNRVLHETGAWQAFASWIHRSVEAQKRLVHQIEMGTLYVEMGVGLAGGAFACSTGAFSLASRLARKTLLYKASAAIQTAGSSMGAIAQLGKGFTEKRLDDLRASMQVIDAKMELARTDLSNNATSMRSMLDTTDVINTQMHHIITSLAVESD